MPAEDSVFSSLKKFYNNRHDWLFGFFSYDMKNEIEPKIFSKPDSRFDGIQFPLAYFFRPEHMIEIRNSELVIHSVNSPEEILAEIEKINMPEFDPQSISIQARTDRGDYLSSVNEIKEHIANGDLYEVNICQEFFSEAALIHGASLFCRLNDISP